LSIDNIYFMKGGDTPVVSKKIKSAIQDNFAVIFRNGNIHCKWVNAANYSNGIIKLIDMKGNVVRNYSDKVIHDFSINTASENIPAGMYIIQVSGKKINGQTKRIQKMVSVIR